LLGTRSEVESTWLKFELDLANSPLIDFVQTRSSASSLDVEELSETAVRVRRLVQLADAWRPVTNDSVHDSDSGRIDAERVAAFANIPLRRLASAIGSNYTTLHKTPDAPSVQEAPGPFARAIELLRKLHPSVQSARAWLNTPHRKLDERAPLQVMLDGHADAVRDMLEASYSGLPT
jgi:hypothetical protein